MGAPTSPSRTAHEVASAPVRRRRWVWVKLAATVGSTLALAQPWGCSRGLGPQGVSSVEPSTVARQSAAQLRIRGSGFGPQAKVDFDNPQASAVDERLEVRLEGGGEEASLAEVVRVSDSELTARLPTTLASRTWSVVVLGAGGVRARLESGLTVVDCLVDDDCNVGLGCGLSRCTDRQCAPAGPVAFRDGDGDGSGAADGGVAGVCPSTDAGLVANSGDCDDTNPFVRAGAAEICDYLDNDCNGLIDDGVTCGVWTQRTDTGGLGAHWYTASAWKPGRVWIAGANAVRVTDGAGAFQNVSAGCAGEWRASWAEPAQGELHLGGTNGAQGILATHGAGSAGCSAVSLNPGTVRVTGLTGFGRAGNAELYGVGAEGVTFHWMPNKNQLESLPSVGVALNDLHGFSVASLFAVGGDTGANSPRVFRFEPGGKTWLDQGVQGLSGAPVGVLNAAWVVSDTLAFAVGDAGGLARWDGTAWKWMTPVPGNPKLVAVRAFGIGQVFILDAMGKVWLSDGTSHRRIYEPAAASAHDMAGTAPNDLWVVGKDGWVVKSP